MLNNRTLIIYPSVLVIFFIVAFILIPALAQQKQDNINGVMIDSEGEEIKVIMKALEEREKELVKREDALSKEEERLNMLRNSIEQSLKQYSTMRSRLQKDLEASSEKDDKSAQGVTRIAKIYESMSPGEAAQRIEKMEDDMAVELLAKIKNKQAGKIMEAISPEKAAFLTMKLAERKGGK